MSKAIKKGLTWKTGILFVLLCVIIGSLVGVIADKASAMCPDGQSSCTGTVHTPREGVRKFKHHHLGHAPRNMRYSAKAKRVILDKLMHFQRAHRTTIGDGGSLTRAQMWRNFTSHDNCYFKVSGSSPSTSAWTCDGPVRAFPDNANWTRDDVKAVFCGGLAGVGVGGAIATGASSGPGAPWVWVGIGAGWAACQWQSKLEDMAGN